MTNRFRAAYAAALLVCLGAEQAVAVEPAGNYPTRPVRIVAPFAAGGLADVLARALGDKLRTRLGQAIIVDNRPGAGGNIGADIVAKAEPDGYTLLMSSAGILTINASLYGRMPFDPAGAFAPVSLVADMSMLCVVNSSSPTRSVGDLIAAAKKDPERLNFGSPGNGTTGHLGMELFQHAAGVKLTHVPYKSAAEVTLAIVGNQINGSFDNPPTVLPHIRSGSLRALAVAAPARLEVLPDVPTFSESGLKGFEASSWFGVVAPAKLPRPLLDRLNREIAAALHEKDIQKRFDNLGARLVGNTPVEFDGYIRAERVKWSGVVKAAGIKLD